MCRIYICSTYFEESELIRLYLLEYVVFIDKYICFCIYVLHFVLLIILRFLSHHFTNKTPTQGILLVECVPALVPDWKISN